MPSVAMKAFVQRPTVSGLAHLVTHSDEADALVATLPSTGIVIDYLNKDRAAEAGR